MFVRNSRGRPRNARAVFIQPCRPTVAAQPPQGDGWAHELKHDGYRLQVHVRDGRVRLYTINGADWSARYPLTAKAVSKGRAIENVDQGQESESRSGHAFALAKVMRNLFVTPNANRFNRPVHLPGFSVWGEAQLERHVHRDGAL